MTTIRIRSYRFKDQAAIEAITYDTGFKGEGLKGRDYFNDRHLFYLIFIAYYARYEPEHFFVAEDTTKQQVVGFICGTPDTENKEKRFNRTMIWRIVSRAILYTSWRHPKTLLTTIKLASMLKEAPSLPNMDADILKQYPAHLHINIQLEYQRGGIGSRLIEHFENHLMDFGIPGVHLGTSSRNHKALPFYMKHKYKIIQEYPVKSHPIFEEIKFLTFAKMLQ